MAESSENQQKTLWEQRKWGAVVVVGTGLQAISPFPTVFSNDLYYKQVKTTACLGKG